MSNAISTFKAYLMRKTAGGSWVKLVDVKDFPDIGAAVEPIEVTTTSDPSRVYIEGIYGNEQKTFTCNYNAADYAALEALEGIEGDYAIWFGAAKAGNAYIPNGRDGKFAGRGYISVYVNGGGINEPVNMTVTLTMTEAFVKQPADPEVLITAVSVSDTHGNTAEEDGLDVFEISGSFVFPMSQTLTVHVEPQSATDQRFIVTNRAQDVAALSHVDQPYGGTGRVMFNVLKEGTVYFSIRTLEGGHTVDYQLDVSVV